MDLNLTGSGCSASLFFKNVCKVASTSTPVNNNSMKSHKRKASDESIFNPPAKKMCFENISESINNDTEVEPVEANISVITIDDDDTIKCDETLISKESSDVTKDMVLNGMSSLEANTIAGGNTEESALYETISETYCGDTYLSNISTISNIHEDSSDATHAISHTNENDSVVFVGEIFPSVEGSHCFAGKIDYNQRNHEFQSQEFKNLYQEQVNILQIKQRSLARPISTNNYHSKKKNPVDGTKRMVIIDGSNVAFAHSSERREFSVEGLSICIEYFVNQGFEVKAVVPQMRLKRSNSTNSELLEKLKTEGKVVISPCKSLANGKSLVSYDDRFILDLAYKFDAAVISNDNFRDLFNENQEYKYIIERRVISYTFCKDSIFLAKDPYGRNGPTLEEILTK